MRARRFGRAGAALLLLLLAGCAGHRNSSPPLPLAPEVLGRINREARGGGVVVALADTVLRASLALRLTADSVHWSERGAERRAPVGALRCIRIPGGRATFGERVFAGAAATLAAGAAATVLFMAAEGGDGAPGLIGGLLINTSLAAPLAFPLGFALAPSLSSSATYRFPDAAGVAYSGPCGSE